MTYAELIDYYGKQAEAARALKVPKQTVSCWRKSGIPFEQQYRIEMKTKGRLRATPPKLNP